MMYEIGDQSQIVSSAEFNVERTAFHRAITLAYAGALRILPCHGQDVLPIYGAHFGRNLTLG